MDAYIIIGNGGVGKSSLVRALTGVRNTDRRLMASVNVPNFLLWAKDSSLQESRVAPGKFIADAVAQGVDATLCTLWPRSAISKGIVYPDASGYIQDFQAAGWNVQPVVLLDDGVSILSLALPATVISRGFSNLRSTPFNSLAASVRTYWGWI